MEVPVTEKESAELLQKNVDKEFLIFPENRDFPVRMKETIPWRWLSKGPNNSFEGVVKKNEAYAWQIGIYANSKALNNLEISFTDFKNENGTTLSKDVFRCINMGGKDYKGKSFKKKVDILLGEVSSLWIMTDVSLGQPSGIYRGKAMISADGTNKQVIDVTLRILDEIAENRGYNTPQNQSRLNWLDSEIAIDNKVVSPFSPIAIHNNTLSILGRKLTFNNDGLPLKITSSFTESNHSTDGFERNILSHDVHFNITEKGKPVVFSSSKPKFITLDSGLAEWITNSTSERFSIDLNGKMESDGNVDYVAKLKVKENTTIDDITLTLPFERSVAKYLMGMGVRGGYRPEKIDWKWGQPNNMIWIGDVNAGIQLKLHDGKDWRNEGKGGCRF